MTRAWHLAAGAVALSLAAAGLLLWQDQGAMIWLANGLPFCG